MSKRNGFLNIIYGFLSQIITFVIGIIIPRLVLVNLGSEANGLLGSVSSILSYLTLLEAGVGTASLQALYKPCAKKDRTSISEIMAATNQYYKRTGYIYLCIVIGMAFAYAFFVKSELSKSDVFIVVLLSGLSGVLGYFFQGKYKILLSAEGRGYVTTNIITFIHIATSITKAILLNNGFNVVAVQTSSFIFLVFQILIYYFYMKSHYPWIDYKVKPNYGAINQRKAVLIHEISNLIFSNTDILLLTIFVSLKSVSVYSMYVMIYGMIKSIAVVMYDGFRHTLGQTFNTDRNHFLKLFNAYEVITLLIAFSLFCICRYLMNPFLRLYTDQVYDIQYVDPYLPWLFAIFYLLHYGRHSSNLVINFAQHFSQTKWRSIIESIINVVISLICVNFFGIYGVLMGTIVALIYRTNDMIIYAARILNRSCLITYKRWIFNLSIFIGVSFLLDQIDISARNYMQLVISAIIISIAIIAIFVIFNALAERENTKYIYHIVKNLISRVVKKRKMSSSFHS